MGSRVSGGVGLGLALGVGLGVVVWVGVGVRIGVGVGARLGVGVRAGPWGRRRLHCPLFTPAAVTPIPPSISLALTALSCPRGCPLLPSIPPSLPPSLPSSATGSLSLRACRSRSDCRRRPGTPGAPGSPRRPALRTIRTRWPIKLRKALGHPLRLGAQGRENPPLGADPMDQLQLLCVG